MRVLSAECLSCGGSCDFDRILCADCAAGLRRVVHRCSNCGHALSVDARYCIHCIQSAGAVRRYYADYLYTGALKQALLSIKFHWRIRGCGQLGSFCIADGVDFAAYDAVVPVPYYWIRRLSRYRQPVDMIMDGLHRLYGVTGSHVLDRVRHTQYQARLNKRERAANIRGAFRLNGDVSGQKIMLVDDVVTTGATIREAAATLRRGGAEVVDVYTLMAGVPR